MLHFLDAVIYGGMLPLFLRRISVPSALGIKGLGMMSTSAVSVGFEESNKHLRYSNLDTGESSSNENDSNLSASFAHLILSSRSRFNVGGKKTDSDGSSSATPGSSSKTRKGKDKKKGAKSTVNGASATVHADTPCLNM